MDVAVEHFGDYVKMLAAGIAHNSGRLADHETGITALEVRERRALGQLTGARAFLHNGGRTWRH